MSTIQEIDDAVRRLSVDERVAFRSWFAVFDGEEWDRQIEGDVVAGGLDWSAADGRREQSRRIRIVLAERLEHGEPLPQIENVSSIAA